MSFCYHGAETLMIPARIPLFPLDIVLFPGQAMPLHIFELRYREMTRHCIATQSPFGIVRASGVNLAHTGCSAMIVKVLKEYEDNNEASDRQQNGAGPSSNGGYFPQRQNGADVPPPVPVKLHSSKNPNVIKLSGDYSQPLGQSSGNAPTRPIMRSNTGEKKKSWFKRRFSKD